MSDIVQEMRAEVDNHQVGAGFAVVTMTVSRDLFERAIAEIEHLRALAGAVSQGQSFAEIRADARAQRKTLEHHAARLKPHLPPGWSILVDADNLIICVDGERGFVITRKALDDLPLDQIIVKARTASTRPIRDIRAEGLGATAFDT